MSSKSDWPSYYNDDDFADSLDAAQKRYFQSDKGKDALRRYFQSEKGKNAQSKYYQKKKFVRICAEWLAQNPGKTVEDFLNEQNLNCG